MDKKIERREFKIEVRSSDEGDKKLVGTPIVYNKSSENMGFFEFIAPGAARNALKVSDVRLLYGHNSDSLLPIARQSSGTLRATETESGVEIEADPPKKNTFVTALMESIERGDIGEMSFGFTVKADEWRDLDKDIPTRTITQIEELFDFSYVSFPAYPDTTAGFRSMNNTDEAIRSLKEARAENTESDSNEPDEKEGSSPMAADPPTEDELETRFNELNDWKRNF